MKWTELALVLASLATLGGCATAVPAMSGASTTPKNRTDLGLGGAARVPLGDLRDPVVLDPGESQYRYAADAGGVVPMAYGRYGIAKEWDLGLMVSGATVRAEARYEKVLQQGTTRSSLVVGLAPYGGWIPDRDQSGSGGRVGFEVPFVYGVEIGGVYEIWIGARGSGEYPTSRNFTSTLICFLCMEAWAFSTLMGRGLKYPAEIFPSGAILRISMT